MKVPTRGADKASTDPAVLARGGGGGYTAQIFGTLKFVVGSFGQVVFLLTEGNIFYPCYAMWQ